MKIERYIAGALLLPFAVVPGLALVAAEPHPSVQGAPTVDSGFEPLMEQVVDLADEIPGMEGRQLRLRLLRIAPGGQIRVHSHRNRPAAFYVVQGATTVLYADGTAKRIPAGGMGYANRNTVHWHRNNESEPALFVAADILQAGMP